MMEKTDCEFYRRAMADEERWQKDYEAAKEAIMEGMRKLLPDADEVIGSLQVQIENAAELRADTLAASREARHYPQLQQQISREGHKTWVTNPIHERVRTMRATYAAMLKDLGLRVNPEKVQTSIGKEAGRAAVAQGGAPAAAFVGSILEDL
jgi:hypothetical protein